MKLITKVASATALTAGLCFVGGAAFAGTSYSSFDAIVPGAQQQWDSSNQSKSGTNAAANLVLSNVGSTYKVNARICNQAETCAAEKTGLGDGWSGSLSAGFLAGTSVHLQLHTSIWTLVRVEAIGKWRSN
ncbi:hypothetical protein [Galbitalea soli]|uniref:Uncharacterized protein n=1 Tax=Galbitalea soli TaxID=1268042 RepID=A0A7C9TTV9_9MICO|nr:hypothetical protein [Galbitalea soli]NEM92402.1 hypothetical protein [Galbitalea soli]NYJ29436.1 hypothetical protein [Galbitalea soli]